VGMLVRWMQIQRSHFEWRQLRSEWADPACSSGKFHSALSAPEGLRAERLESKLRLAERPLPSGAAGYVARWANTPSWLPAATALLVRNRRFGFEEWMVTVNSSAPEGYNPEHYLGIVHLGALQGTRRLMRDEKSGYVALALGGEPTAEEMEESLGYVDEVAFSMLEPLLLCRHVRTGAPLLICGEDDPLRDAVEWPPLAVLGYIDRFPVNPRDVPTSPPTRAWLRGLLRTTDSATRRHRVALNTARAGEVSWELGALLDRNPGEGIPVWVDGDGRMHTESYAPTRHPYDVRRTLRWVGAPASWRGFGRGRARARALARRGVEAVRYTVTRPGMATPAQRRESPHAWLLPDSGPDRCPLFSAVHPITADQLVTRDPSEARELGYGSVEILGYALALAPVTGTLRRPQLSVPWGSRFGEVLTLSEDHLRDPTDLK
jgi:hypothetical protein